MINVWCGVFCSMSWYWVVWNSVLFCSMLKFYFNAKYCSVLYFVWKYLTMWYNMLYCVMLCCINYIVYVITMFHVLLSCFVLLLYCLYVKTCFCVLLYFCVTLQCHAVCYNIVSCLVMLFYNIILLCRVVQFHFVFSNVDI